MTVLVHKAQMLNVQMAEDTLGCPGGMEVQDQTTLRAQFFHVDWSLRRYEVVACCLGLVYFLLIWRTHLVFSPGLARLFAAKTLELTALICALSVPLVLGRAAQYGAVHGRAAVFSAACWTAAARPYWTLDYMLRTLRRAAVLFAAIYLFLHLKHLIVWLRRENFDLFFWDLDRRLHFGVQPNIWAMRAFGADDHLAVLFDWLYIKYFPFKLIVSVFFLLEIRGRELTERFVTAYALLWLLGGLMYLMMPTDGPCYAVLLNSSVPREARSHVFRFPVVRSLPREYVQTYEAAKIPTAKYYQERLWTDRRDFLRGAEYPGVFYGIAAMPSLHVAAVVMLAIFLWCASPLLGGIGFIYTAVIFFGSIFLQWHYAVDGYVGAVFACLISFVALFGRKHASSHAGAYAHGVKESQRLPRPQSA